MEMRQLQYFVTAVRLGSYTKAARALYISQQAVSKSVAGLERELREQLIRRESRQLTLTEFGETFFDRADELLAEFHDLASLSQRRCLSNRASRPLSIAVTSLPLSGPLINLSVFEALKRTFCTLDLSLIFQSSGACFAALNAGVVDAAIIPGRQLDDTYRCTRLFSAYPMLALSHHHELATRSAIALADLQGRTVARPSDLRFVYPTLNEQLSRNLVEVTYVDITPGVDRYQEFFNSGGMAFSASSASFDFPYSEVTVRPLKPQDRFHVPIYLLSRRTGDELIPESVETYLKRRLRHDSSIRQG